MDDFLNRIEDLSPQQLRLLADRLRRRLEQQQEERHAAIAVVGMACRFPEASSPQEFWALLREGRDVVRQVPADRWSLDDFYDSDRTAPGKMYCGHGAFLEHVDRFDPSFFNISPREAENMDPQQRLLLEVGWEAIENAGWATEIHGSNTGVFVGIGPSSYTGGMSVGRPTQINAYTGAGNLSSTAAGRISHVFGLRGPSLAVDTACSSSLVAVHLAVQSLRNGESDAALVAGVNLALAPEVTVYFCKVGVLSSSGKCRSFDAAADGYVRGEGCGVVILRRLADALTAGDPILAVIRGSAVNHDGRGGGLTVPNRASQVRVIRKALDDAGLTPHELDYIEVQGTGTKLGDAIELEAISEALIHPRGTGPTLKAGCVKANLGHLEAASGMAALIKTVLTLQHGEFVPHIHFHQPHASFPDSKSFEIPTQVANWERARTCPRRAAVSAFGFSGTNAELILEDAEAFRRPADEGTPLVEKTPEQAFANEALSASVNADCSTNGSSGGDWNLLCISAKTGPALERFVQRMLERLEQSDDAAWPDICHTANLRRPERLRVGVCAASRAQAQCLLVNELDRIQGSEQDSAQTSEQTARTPRVHPALRVGLFFPGTCSEAELRAAAELARPYAEKHEAIEDFCKSGSVLSALSLLKLHRALWMLWQLWGLKPDVAWGFGLGQLSAACAAGIVSWESAIKASAADSVKFDEELVDILVPVDSISDVERLPRARAFGKWTPDWIRASVPRAAVDDLNAKIPIEVKLDRYIPLSPTLMGHIPTSQSLSQPLSLGLVSTVAGAMYPVDGHTDNSFLQRVAHEPFDLPQSTNHLKNQCDVVLGMGATHVDIELPVHPTISLSASRKDAMQALASLFVGGQDWNWRTIDAPWRRQVTFVPNYPFEKRRCWIDRPAFGVVPETDATSDTRKRSTELAVQQWKEEWKATDPAQRRERVEQLVVRVVSQTLGLEAQHVEPNRSLIDLGFDSMMAAELTSQLFDITGQPINFTALIQSPYISTLVDILSAPPTSDSHDQLPVLEPGDRTAAYKPTTEQLRYWFFQRFLPDSPIHHNVVALRMKGDIDSVRLPAALTAVAERHDILRTSYPSVDGQPIGRVQDQLDIELIEGTTGANCSTDAWLETEARRPFRLEMGPLWRVGLLHANDGEAILVVTAHHIIADGWTLALLLQELLERWLGSLKDRQDEPPKLQFADYARWRQSCSEQKVFDRDIESWGSRLAQSDSILHLPTDYPRGPVTGDGRLCVCKLSSDLVERLRQRGKDMDATLFTVMLAGYALAVHRYSGQFRFNLGTPTAGRDHPGTKGMLGLLMNTLAVPFDFNGMVRCEQLLIWTRDIVRQAMSHREAPFSRVVEATGAHRDSELNPLFQVLFAFQNIPWNVRPIPNVALEPRMVDPKTAAFELTTMIAFYEGEAHVVWQYRSELFSKKTIDRLQQIFVASLERLAGNGSTCLVVDGVSDADRRELIEIGVGPVRDFPRAMRLEEIFERAVRETPDLPAIFFEGQTISFSELDARANAVAHALRENAVAHQSLVGLAMDRTPDMLAGLLGILKAGCAYVPLDLQYPPDRLKLICGDSKLRWILTSVDCLCRLPELSVQRLLMEDIPNTAPPLPPLVAGSQEDVAYVLYTSGSTGTPKGVAIPHRVPLHRLHADVEPVGQADTLCSQTSINFVDSLWELFAAWNQGRPTLLLPSARASDLNELVFQLNEHGVTRLLLVPSLLRAILDSKIPLAERLPKLKHVICSGEPLAAALSKGFADRLPGVKLTNLYGTTEVWDATQADCFQFSPPQHIPIGRPLPNTRMVVLDTRFRLAPRGAVGELYVGGEGLARAYLGRPGLTASHFVPDPFDARPGRRLYRTGDLVRWRDDGCLDSQGRIDHQLSIRGYRAEPAEIEAAMCQHPKIRAAAVMLESNGSLTGFFEPEAESQPSLEEVRAVCRRFLPAALIPSCFVSLTKLPMTPSGKVDRKRLPGLPRERIKSTRQLVLPRSETERQLAEIWKDILSLSELGVDDNFFDLGGHSLQATRMLSRVQQQLGRDVSLRVFFNEPTISACAEDLEMAVRVVDSPVLKRNLIETPVSPAQQRIWVLQQLAPDLPHYHLAILIRVNGCLDRELLNNAVQQITHRHDVLRTSIRSTGEGLVQLVTRCDTAIESVDLRQQAAEVRERELRHAALEIARRPFDLERPPLFRCCVFRLDEDQHAVLVVAHHIIMDGWSVGVLAAELYEFYQSQCDKRSPRLPMLPVQYTDYSVWQQSRMEQSEHRERLEQWCQRLADAPQSLNLPLTRARAPSPSFAGAILESNMPAATVHKLRRWGQREGASLFMALLSTFQQLLHELSGQDDLLIGCPVAGRIRPELEPMLGVFSNTLVLRSRHPAQQSAREHLRATREACLWAFENQETPFEQIVSRISQQRDFSRQPLVQVLLTLQNTPTPAVQAPDLELSAETFDLGIARFDLTVYATEIQDSLRVVWEYSTDLFDRSLIADFQDQWLKLIEQLGAEQDEGPAGAAYLNSPAFEVENSLNRCGALTKALETDDPLTLFRRHVELRPTATAILASDGVWSYQRLAEQSAGWASCLEDVGIQRGEVVAVPALRSGNTIAAMLAIWSVGGAYLPLMPDLTMSRKERVCDDARVRFALALERDDTRYSETIRCVRWKPSEQGILALGNAKNLLQVAPPRDLAAYVLSTSGSSGIPQAVCMSRRSLCGLLAWMQRDSTAKVGDVTLQYAPLSFDVSFQEIFSTLISGGTLFIPSDELRRDIKALVRATREQGVARAFLPTALLQDFVAAATNEHPDSLREIIVAGEALRISPEIRSFFKRHAHIKLVNHYGPTETHVVTSETLGSQFEDWGEAPPIGRPIPGAMTWVFDTSLTECATLAPGELYIGGTSVGLGYIGRPRQTAERFVPDPGTQCPGGRMFKTGDRVRWLAEGSLEFLGRIDRQVKVRGYRIEPSEVELALQNCPGVNECVVLAQSGSSLVTHLCCYVVPAKAGLKVDELQAFLRLRLPEHMVPTQWSVVDSLPRNHHGKVDLRALPPVTSEATRTICSAPPKTTTELRVAAIWRELLGLESIGISEDFFAIGGHSLTAARMIARIRGEFAVEVPLRFLFERPTIEGLATALDHGQFTDPLPPLRSGLATMPISSSAQRRLWALHQLAPDSPAYNLATAIWIQGALDYDALQTAVSEILARHEVLRSKWVDGSNGPLPQPVPSEPFVLDVQCPNWSATELQQQVALAASSFARRPFDLSSGQLFRLQLLQLGPDQHVGLVACHHLAADGWSVSILLSEIASLYQAASQGHQSPLAPLALRYADYAAWETECLKSPRLDRQREYWTQKLAGVPDLMLAPSSNTILHTWQGDVLVAEIPTELHRALAALAQAEGATLYMTLLSGLQALLFHYTSQNDFCIGSVVSGRRQALTERLVGPFVNMLALRADLKGDPSFRDLLRRVRHTMLEALANQDLPFEETIEGRSVPVQLVFVFHNQPMPVIQTGALRLEPTAVSLGAARFDLTIDAQERGGGGIDVRLEFRSDAFGRDTIRQFFQAWVTLLESAVANPEQWLSGLSLLDAAQEQALLQEWSFDDEFES